MKKTYCLYWNLNHFEQPAFHDFVVERLRFPEILVVLVSLLQSGLPYFFQENYQLIHTFRYYMEHLLVLHLPTAIYKINFYFMFLLYNIVLNKSIFLNLSLSAWLPSSKSEGDTVIGSSFSYFGKLYYEMPLHLQDY